MKESLLNALENPLVSIIVPLYNMEQFLSETIESVLSQSVIDWEMLIINDGSTDKSIEIAQSFVEQYPHKIRIFHHKNIENKGANASRNLGIENAKGKFITFLDADDLFFPDTLELQLKAFAENPEADAVCGTFECWFSWSDQNNKRNRDFIVDLVLEKEKLHQPPALLIQNLIAGGRKPGINCVMLRREFVGTIGEFDESYRYLWEDQIIWAKLTLNGKIFVMDAVVTKYRQHTSSMSAVDSQNGQDILSVNIYLDWLESYLKKQEIKDANVWKSLNGFRRILYFETKFRKIKQLYRNLFPLHRRYKIRDKLTRSKQILKRFGKTLSAKK